MGTGRARPNQANRRPPTSHVNKLNNIILKVLNHFKKSEMFFSSAERFSYLVRLQLSPPSQEESLPLKCLLSELFLECPVSSSFDSPSSKHHAAFVIVKTMSNLFRYLSSDQNGYLVDCDSLEAAFSRTAIFRISKYYTSRIFCD